MIATWSATAGTPTRDVIVIVGSPSTVTGAMDELRRISVGGSVLVVCERNETPLGRIARGIDHLHEEIEAFERAARVAFLAEAAPVAEAIGPRELRAPNPPKRPAWATCLRAWR